MSKLEEQSHNGYESLIFPCNCGDGDYLRIAWDDDPEFRALWIESHSRPYGWDRLKRAWAALMGRDIQNTEIILDDLTVEKIYAYLGLKPVGK